jgi:hypothetical protein
MIDLFEVIEDRGLLGSVVQSKRFYYDIKTTKCPPTRALGCIKGGNCYEQSSLSL